MEPYRGPRSGETHLPVPRTKPQVVDTSRLNNPKWREMFNDGVLYVVDVVKKTSTKGVLQDRLLLVGEQMLMLSDFDGRIKRFIFLWDIEEAHYRELVAGGVLEIMLQIKGDGSLVYRASNWNALVVLSHLRYPLVTPPEPLKITKVGTVKEMKSMRRMVASSQKSMASPKTKLATMKKTGVFEQRRGPKLFPTPDVVVPLTKEGETIGMDIDSDMVLRNVTSHSPAQRAGVGTFIGKKLLTVNNIDVFNEPDTTQAALNIKEVPLKFGDAGPTHPDTSKGQTGFVVHKKDTPQIGLTISKAMVLTSVQGPAKDSGGEAFIGRKILSVQGSSINKLEELMRYKKLSSVSIVFDKPDGWVPPAPQDPPKGDEIAKSEKTNEKEPQKEPEQHAPTENAASPSQLVTLNMKNLILHSNESPDAGEETKPVQGIPPWEIFGRCCPHLDREPIEEVKTERPGSVPVVKPDPPSVSPSVSEDEEQEEQGLNPEVVRLIEKLADRQEKTENALETVLKIQLESQATQSLLYPPYVQEREGGPLSIVESDCEDSERDADVSSLHLVPLLPASMTSRRAASTRPSFRTHRPVPMEVRKSIGYVPDPDLYRRQ